MNGSYSFSFFTEFNPSHSSKKNRTPNGDEKEQGKKIIILAVGREAQTAGAVNESSSAVAVMEEAMLTAERCEMRALLFQLGHHDVVYLTSSIASDRVDREIGPRAGCSNSRSCPPC